MKHIRFVLAFLVAACHTPAPRTQPSVIQAGVVRVVRELPPIPDSVPSSLGPVAVLWEANLANERGESLLGEVRVRERHIVLSASLRSTANKVTAWQILEHERCHITMNDAGLRFAIDPILVQQICDAFATATVIDMLARR